MSKRYTRRRFLSYSAMASGGLMLAACSGGSSGRGGAAEDRPSGADASGLPDIESPTILTDRADIPSRFNERPEFAEMVAAGTLPPVAERIGQDPLVIRPLDGVGTYGGTIRRAFLGVADDQNGNRFCAGPDSLLYWDSGRTTVVPYIARNFELSDDFTELILHLRRGMRWSDGAPFTADDIVFWREEMSLRPEVSPRGAPALRVNGQEVRVEKVDTFTVRFEAPAPHPMLPALLASGLSRDVGGQTVGGRTGGGGFAPMHYLSQFLPAFSSEDEVNARARDAGYNGWAPYFLDRASWALNPDLPTVTPWVVTQPINDPPWNLFASPYSIWVDAEGNQLPYIGEITMVDGMEINTIVLQTTTGNLDFQDRHLEAASLPVLVDNEGRGDYTVHRTPGEVMDFGVLLNLAYDADPVLADLLRTVEFRRALSLAIERDQVNEAFFLGTSRPSATTVSDSSPYFPGEEWSTKWATFDPDRANELLDQIGLIDKDGDGFRIRPDGNGRIRLDYQAVKAFADFPAIGEMIRQQWASIGIDLSVQQLDINLFVERVEANEIMLSGHSVGTDDPFINPGGLVLRTSGFVSRIIGVPYIQWYESGGSQGAEPPSSLQVLKDATELLATGMSAPEDERVEIAKELYRLHADQVWTIGVVGFGLSAYGMYTANNRLRNVPARVLNTDHQRTVCNTFPMTFYYE